METTKTNTQALNEGAKVIEKSFNEVNATLTEMYKKQADLASSFYNNLLNFGSASNNGWHQNGSISNVFSNMGITKWFTNPFASFSAQNPFMATIETSMKQITDFNQNLLSTFGNNFHAKETDLQAISEEYKETVNARLEASKNVLASVSQAFNDQMASSIETNKKTLNEVAGQMEEVMKQNQKLWSDMFKTFQQPLNGEEKKNKEQSSGEIKKRSTANVTA